MAKQLSAKVGEYEKDGQKRGRYVNVGVILSTDKGEYILLDPTVNLGAVLTLQNMMNHKAGKKTGDRVMVGIWSDQQSGGGSSEGGGGARPDLDDEIPF